MSVLEPNIKLAAVLVQAFDVFICGCFARRSQEFQVLCRLNKFLLRGKSSCVGGNDISVGLTVSGWVLGWI